jgi:polyisoprenyl-teichoic acid--peptidoglycan teichoic acid transferase
VRMDPAQNQTSILSIPRDLLVRFHYKGQPYTDKFNSTYSLGGDDLVEKVAEATLPGITINHVIDFNFASFIQLIDAIGCVYIDVDHRYLNPGDPTYLPINIQPGYQRLCSYKALSYVRYRHTDSDFVRVARQQDFIRQAKEQLGLWGFLTKYSSLAKAFGRAVWTDIRGAHEVANLLELAFFSLSKPVRQVTFNYNDSAYPINTSAGPAEAVTSTPELIRQSIDNFLYEHPKPLIATGTAATSHTTTHASHTSHHHRKRPVTVGVGTNDLYALSPGVSAQALALSVDVDFPVYLPSVQTGPAIASDFHPYKVGDEQHHLHYGYRVDWSTGSEGEYYGIEGINWANPPLFANPNATETIDGRTYLFVDDGSAFRYIGWRERGVLYWISNTLNKDLSNAQMLALAESARPIH